MAIKDDAAAKWWDSLGVPSVEADAFAVAFGAFCAGNRFSVSRFAKQIARYLIGVDGQVSEKSFGEFLQRFGPVSVCLKKAEGFVESDSGRPQRWYHGRIGRGDAEALLKAAGAGAFLVRLSESQPDKLAAQYLTIKDGKPAIKNNLVYNAGEKGFALTAGLDRCFASIADLLSAQATAGRMTVAAVSALHTSYVPTGSSGSGGDPYAAFDPSAAGAGSTSAGPGGSSGGADPYASFDPTAAGAGSGSGTGRAAPGSDPYASFDPSMAGGGAPGGTAAAPSADPYATFDPTAAGSGGGSGAAPASGGAYAMFDPSAASRK